MSQVVEVGGIPRVVNSDVSAGRRTMALATSRSLGDSALKTPKPLLSAHPTVRVCRLDFDRDAFLVSREQRL